MEKKLKVFERLPEKSKIPSIKKVVIVITQEKK